VSAALPAGAGKTYTMSGDSSNYTQRGVVPRAVHHIFREMDLRVEKEMVVRCSYLEIYNGEGGGKHCVAPVYMCG
jgi:hypothetical protein